MLDVARKMVDRNISSVALTDDKDRIAGILTERDIVKAVTNGVAPKAVTARSLMTHKVVSIGKNSPIEDAARMMALKNIRHLMVKDPSNETIVGIITLTDLARYLRKNLANEEIISPEVWELFF